MSREENRMNEQKKIWKGEHEKKAGKRDKQQGEPQNKSKTCHQDGKQEKIQTETETNVIINKWRRHRDIIIHTNKGLGTGIFKVLLEIKIHLQKAVIV